MEARGPRRRVGGALTGWGAAWWLVAWWASPAASQPTPDELNPPPETSQAVEDPLVDTGGPDGGMIHEVVYGPGQDGLNAFALTDVGVYRWAEDDGRWVHEVLLPPELRLSPALPFKVDPVHLVDGMGAYQGFYGPQDVQLLLDSRHILVLNQKGELHRARRGGGRWEALAREGAGKSPMRVSALVGRAELEQVFVLAAERRGEEGREASVLWQRDSRSGQWRQQPVEGRAVLVQAARSGVGASWRYPGLVPSVREGVDAYQVERFLRLRTTPDESVRYQEIEWAAQLRASSEAVRRGCQGATGMLEATTAAGYNEPPVLVALGPRALCVSTDGGATFYVRDGLLRTSNSLERVGDLISAVAFADKQASSGVRLLVGTEGVLNPAGPSGRGHGGRLFLSDDAGVSWQEVTPDIDAPGGFIGLAAGPEQGDARPVWLVTARRGVYRSMQGGMGFTRASQGISAMPIHALAADPLTPGDVWAASPAGLFNHAGRWRRNAVVGTRSLGTEEPGAGSKGQLWVGTYWGAVMLRDQSGRLDTEPLPPRPGGPDGPEVPIEVEAGALPRPIPRATGVRPVSMVVPTGLDAQRRDEGYAIEDGAGILRRQAGAWERVPLPEQGAIKVRAMTSAVLDEAHRGALMLGTVVRGERAVGMAWLHRPGEGWSQVELPEGAAPLSAARVGGQVWVSLASGMLVPIDTVGGQPRLLEALEGRRMCRALILRRDQHLACLAESVDEAPDSIEAPRPIAETILWPRDVLKPGARPGGETRRWRHMASNPLGRPFEGPLLATFNSTREMGLHLWVTRGHGVWTRQVALAGELPYMPPEQGPSTMSWLLPVALTGAVAAVGLLLLVWARRRRR